MSSRLHDQVVEAVALLVDGREELVRRPRRLQSTSRCSRLVTDALIDASGVRRSCDTARSSDTRSSSASARSTRLGRARPRWRPRSSA